MTTSPAITDLSTATPVEIDTVLAGIWARIDQQRTSQWHYESLVRKGERGDYWYGQPHRLAENAKLAAEYKAKADAIQVEADPYEAEYRRRGGWNRYFLVQNDNGHVHRGMNCSTCFPTTQYAWLIDLADCDEKAMVAEVGETACTVCFPDAPTFKGFGDGTSTYAKRTQAEKDARAAEKAQKAAEKAAKAIVDVDGQPLKDSHGYVLKTKVAARNELSNLIQYAAWYSSTREENLAHAERIAAALRANAPEIDVTKVVANAVKKVGKEGGSIYGFAARINAL